MPSEYDDPTRAPGSKPAEFPIPFVASPSPYGSTSRLKTMTFGLTYIKATNDPSESPDSAFWQAGRHAKSSARWTYHEIATNHMVLSNRPNELAEVLLALA